jgi:lysophospholipid hydrolase
MKEKLLDLTFPITSFFHGSRFNKGIHKFLGDIRIQDLVLNFYCVSVDIRNSRQVVHRKGIAWKAVRASMSLAGYLPPMSEGNALLVDGGYMNVLPADIMSESGAKKVIAVDVAYEKVMDWYEYGCELSGWWLIWNS